MKLVLVILAAAIFTFAFILVRRLSGGDAMFVKVASALKTQSYILSQTGSPVSAVGKGDGPWKVSLARDGRHHGYYSVNATGPKGTVSLKAYWRENSGGTVEVYAIYHSAPFKQDELVWGAPRPELN